MEQYSVFHQLTNLSFLNLYSKVIYGALKMDVFSKLTNKITVKQLVSDNNWHEDNTFYLLSTLAALGFLDRDGDYFINNNEAQKYLVKDSKDYLGGFIMYYGLNEGAVEMDVEKLVTQGPQLLMQQEMNDQLDFSQYGAMLRQAQAGYRQQEILKIIRSLPENKTIKKVLDVGCATGLLGIAVIEDEPMRSGVLFDRLPANLIQESIKQAKVKNSIQVISGDFMQDDIGDGYDLIMAVSVMLFAKGKMEILLKKLYDALNPGGVLVIVSEGIETDLSGPSDMLLGYLPYYFQGMDMAVKKDEVVEAAKQAGFTKFEKITKQLCSGMQDIDIIRK